MSCSTCGSAGSCGCSTVVIPVGPAGTNGTNGTSVTVVAEAAGANCVYGGVKVTDGAGNVTYVCTGAPGAAGSNGTSPSKYASTFVVTYAIGVIPNPITITKAALIACGAYTNTCITTPQDFDFNITVWRNTGGTQWSNVTNNSTYISSITYDTASSQLVVQAALSQAGTYRVVVIG